MLREERIPSEWLFSEKPADRLGEEDCAAEGAGFHCNPAAPQAGGWRMRGAGRGVVNGASCLLEFEAGGRARRRGGAGGEVGGREKGGLARGSGGSGRGRLELCLRGRQATAEAAAVAWVGLKQTAAPQTPWSGSPRGRAPETKSSGSPDAAGGRSAGQHLARQRLPALARSAAARRGLRAGRCRASSPTREASSRTRSSSGS